MKKINKLEKLESLQNEHNELFDRFVEFAQDKEESQNSYIKNISVTNNETGEVFAMQHSLQRKLHEQHSIFKQKVGFIHYLAKERGLEEVYFLTITAPSQYHPFKTNNGEKKLNPKFAFDSISEAIPASYKAVEKISRKFYKALKERLRGSGIDGSLLYVKVNEFHESYINHQHMMIMLPPSIKVYSQKRKKTISLGLWARDKFYEILKLEDFNYSTHPERKTNDFKKIEDDGRSISNYIMKYIQKSMSMSKPDEYGSSITSYFLQGWLSANRIRHYASSNVPINQVEYSKLYKSLDQEEKDRLISIAQKNKTNLMIELSKIVTITRRVKDRLGRFKEKIIAATSSIYKIVSDTLKIKTYSYEKDDIVESRRLQELTIHRNNELSYRKSNFSSQNNFCSYNVVKE